jgi:GMP synthase-like glutamine amidotransferase
MIKIHFLIHVPFERPAYIEEWALGRGYKLSSTMFYKNYNLPDIKEIDWLVIMGGPMSVNEEVKYPWLINEKRFIKEAIDNGKVVIGICLGAQLIADVLGAKVYKNTYKEIGWFPVHFTGPARKHTLFSPLPEEIMVFHWHGETFEIPDGAIHIAKSEGCINQAFIFNNKVLAFQFHFEMTEDAILKLTEEGNGELIPAKYIQNGGEIRDRREYISSANNCLKIILDNLEIIID